MKKFKISKLKTTSVGQLVYLASVSAEGFGKIRYVYTNYNGVAPIAVDQMIELDESRIKSVKGSDGIEREWYI